MKIKQELRKQGHSSFRCDGDFGGSEWVVLLAGTIAVELFCEEKREDYNLEKLWVLKRTMEEMWTKDTGDIEKFMFDEEDEVSFLDEEDEDEGIDEE